MSTLAPQDHSETVAVFRHGVVGPLLGRDFDHGELAEALRVLSQQRFRVPNLAITRSFSVPTLERWYYAFKSGGLEALKPRARSDRGVARNLNPEEAALLLDIRREHPSASVALILQTLVTEGKLKADQVDPETVRRLYRRHGLTRQAMRDGSGQHTRLRWQAERPEALWHADVCHGAPIVVDKVSKPVRIHAILDDCSRFIVAIQAVHAERETDMLALMVPALRRYGAPDVLYLDNGATYRGDVLRTACSRLNITLLHAQPYDPQARGKMERFWRTLREGCLDHIGALQSLHELNVRLLAFVDQYYHQRPHGGLMGRTPASAHAWNPATPVDELDDKRLEAALTVRESRRVRRDTTISVHGKDWEVDQGFLAGRVVTVGYSLLDPDSAPWIEHEGKRYPMHRVDPEANRHRKRPQRHPGQQRSRSSVAFDPARTMVNKMVGRKEVGQ